MWVGSGQRMGAGVPIRGAVMVAREQELQVWELKAPDLEPGAVLIETVASEVCGTDVHLWHGRLSGVPYPIVPGHVSVGRGLEARDVDRDALDQPLEPGDLITFYDVHEVCYRCWFCLVARQPNRCPQRKVYGITYSAKEGPLGGWAERILSQAWCKGGKDPAATGCRGCDRWKLWSLYRVRRRGKGGCQAGR